LRMWLAVGSTRSLQVLRWCVRLCGQKQRRVDSGAG